MFNIIKNNQFKFLNNFLIKVSTTQKYYFLVQIQKFQFIFFIDFHVESNYRYMLNKCRLATREEESQG